MRDTGTQEMYLITIDRLSKLKSNVKSIDVAEARGFSKSTVHNALKTLEKKGLVAFLPSGVALTRQGKKRADVVQKKHKNISQILVMMGASKELAEDNAGRIEHVISDDLSCILKKYIDNN